MSALLVGPGGRVEVDNEVGNPLPVTVVGGSITFPASVEIANDVGNPIPVTAVSLPLPSGASTDAGLVAIAAALASLLTELGQKLEPGQQVALDAATLAALESVTAAVANFPADYPDAATLAKAEQIRALLAGTVAVSLAAFPAFPELEVKNDAGSPLAVTGPLTDAQLRATPVPVSGTVTATLGEIEVKNDAGNPIPVNGTVAVSNQPTQPLTDTQLRATAVPVSGPATDAQLRATPVPISGTVTANLGTIDGAATAVAQTDGSQKAQLVDAGGQAAEVNTRADGIVALEVSDDCTSFEAFHQTLVASTDTIAAAVSTSSRVRQRCMRPRRG